MKLRLLNDHATLIGRILIDVLRLMNWMFFITNVISCICISSLWSSKSLGIIPNLVSLKTLLFYYIECYLWDSLTWFGEFKFETHYTPDTTFQLTHPFHQRNSRMFWAMFVLGLQIFPKFEQVPSNFETYVKTHVTYVKKHMSRAFRLKMSV